MTINKQYVRQKAFSLLELLIGVMLITVISVITIPNIEPMLVTVKFYRLTHHVQRLLQLARLTAMTEDQSLKLCPSANGIQCSENWSQGFLLLMTNDAQHRVTSYLQNDPHIQITYRGFPYADRIIVQPNGLLNQQNGTFTFHYTRGTMSLTKKIIINRSGRLRVV
jgi:type IV fimbrial biogenesis protein FimT